MSIRLPDTPQGTRFDVDLEEADPLLREGGEDGPGATDDNGPFPPSSPAIFDKLPPTSKLQSSPPGPTPVPKLQVFLIASTRASQTLSYFVVFPFVNKMLVELGVSDATSVGQSAASSRVTT
jgi:hypothetical protein